jgi:histone deacetylase complex regulatory component SIN3
MKDSDKSYPHVFSKWDKKDYNTLSKHLDVKIEKEEKVIIGQSANGKNKWGKEIKSYYCEELESLSKDLKIQFLEKIIKKGVRIGDDYFLGTQMVKKQLELICKDN